MGDIVKGKQAKNGIITILIAERTTLNDGSSTPNSYQEFLDVAAENLMLN